MKPDRPKLITFGISHFCEKARWALDWHGIDYEEVGWPPGLHQILAKRCGAACTTLPILLDGATVIQGSGAIIDWADQSAQERGRDLTLADTLEIEERADDSIGVHVRRLLYAEMLPKYSQLVKPGLFQNVSRAHRLIGHMMWPVTRQAMMQMYDITPAAASESRSTLETELDWLDSLLADDHTYLVGDRFSRADLTVSSLLAPFACPEEIPAIRDSTFPGALVADTERWRQRPIMRWVKEQYEAHRAPLRHAILASNYRSTSVNVLILAFCLSGLFPSHAAADLTIKKGDTAAERDVEIAHQFIASHMDQIFLGWDSILHGIDTEQRRTVEQNLGDYRDRFRHKWNDITIVVADGSRMCVEGETLGKAKRKGLLPRGPLHVKRQNKIWVCLYDHVRSGLDRCGLVDTLVNEASQQYGVPHNSHHEQTSDAAYLFGDAAGAVCNRMMPAGQRRFMASSRNRANWGPCFSDGQCDSGLCRKNNEGPDDDYDGKVCVASDRNITPPEACRSGPILFEDKYYRGKRFEVRRDDGYLIGFQDKASSLCMPPGWTLTIYNKSNFNGLSQPFLQDGPNLGSRFGGIFNDRVSSVKVTPPSR